MAEYIECKALLDYIDKRIPKLIASSDGKHIVYIETIREVIVKFPTADVAPVRHGHIIWKRRRRGGFRHVKCLHRFCNFVIEDNAPCKHIAKIDERYTIDEPYCSECGKLLGDFLNYCGNCGAKMDEQ